MNGWMNDSNGIWMSLAMAIGAMMLCVVVYIVVRFASRSPHPRGHTLALRRSLVLLAAFALAGAFAVVAVAVPRTQAVLTIHHQTRGCHAWSLNGGSDAVNQAVTLRRGGSISVTNDDVMSQKLIETSGTPVTYSRIAGGGFSRLKTYPPDMLARQGSSSKITFFKVGIYRFTTKAGAMPNLTTVGADNVLRLTVRITP